MSESAVVPFRSRLQEAENLIEKECEEAREDLLEFADYLRGMVDKGEIIGIACVAFHNHPTKTEEYVRHYPVVVPAQVIGMVETLKAGLVIDMLATEVDDDE